MFSVCASAHALEAPEKPSGYVNDYAGMLSTAAKARLETRLGEFERATTNQVLVAIFPSLEGGSLEDFSIRLAEKWKIGRGDRDNGVILLVFRDDREVRIEVGYGLEGALPDATASRIIRERFVPAFKAGDYDGGVERSVEAIMAATKGEYGAAPPGEDRMREFAPFIFAAMLLFAFAPIFCYGFVILALTHVFGFPLGFVGGLVTAFALMMAHGVLTRALFGQTLGTPHGRHTGPGMFGGGWYGGGGGGGWSSGGGFGGFGGGGGGGFGGGGASGRW